MSILNLAVLSFYDSLQLGLLDLIFCGAASVSSGLELPDDPKQVSFHVLLALKEVSHIGLKVGIIYMYMCI